MRENCGRKCLWGELHFDVTLTLVTLLEGLTGAWWGGRAIAAYHSADK